MLQLVMVWNEFYSFLPFLAAILVAILDFYFFKMH